MICPRVNAPIIGKSQRHSGAGCGLLDVRPSLRAIFYKGADIISKKVEYEGSYGSIKGLEDLFEDSHL
jgi:hypothetical protein